MKPSQSRGNFHGLLGDKQYMGMGTDVECERTRDSVGSSVKNLPAMQEPPQIQVQFLGLEEPLEEGMATHSGVLVLENPIDKGAWWATVRRVTKSQTRLK